VSVYKSGGTPKCLEDYNAKRDHVFRLSMSKGMSYYQQERHYSVEELLVQSDKLMYEQKKRKKKS
jgi:GGDEF domain-containing protein